MRTLSFNHVIGSGSMGTVYHAELRVPGGFRRPCAVKVIKAQGPDREHFVSRMRDEARLLGMLQDEQILGVTDLVLVESHDAVIMEYVEGVDLHEIQVNERVPPRALAELGAEIAGTLHRAHTANHPATGEPLNVIHRDVKPANIMVTVRGGVRLLDFGVARAAFASRESHTQGLVLGTLNYFPPEILAGEEPTPAVDIYGLGISLWECATGKEWGPPRVQQKRFERRVDQKLAELGGEYAPLLPVLRQVLQWDPELRPDGGVVERSLLHAADSSTGRGLRTWAREAVPGILKARTSRQGNDELVGRTIAVEDFKRGSTPGIVERRGPAALDEAPIITPQRPPPDPTTTWNSESDAETAVRPGASPSASKAGGAPVQSSAKPPAKKSRGKAKKDKRGMSPALAVVLGIVIGLVILSLLVGVLVAIVVVVWFLAVG